MGTKGLSCALAALVMAAGCGSVRQSDVDAGDFDAPRPDAAIDAPSIDAPSIDAPSIDATEIDATSIDATPIDAGLCGNGTVDPNEECDGPPSDASCVTLGFATGTLGCTAGCTFDRSGCASTSANLVVWYRFNESAGAATVADSSGNNVTGTAVGGTILGNTGAVGNGLGLNGSTGYINAGTPSVVTNLPAVTVEAWVNLAGQTVNGASLVAKTAGNQNVDFALLVDDNPASSAWWLSSAVDATYGYRSIQTTGNQVTVGTWVHLAGVYVVSTNTRLIYVNGLAVTPDPSLSFGQNVAAPMNEAGPLRVGNYVWDGGSQFGFLRGTVDEVKIWNVQRTPAQICADAGGLAGGSGGCDLRPVTSP